MKCEWIQSRGAQLSLNVFNVGHPHDHLVIIFDDLRSCQAAGGERLSSGWEAMMNRPVPGVQALVPWSFVAWVRIIRPLWNFKNTSWPTNRSNMKSHESNTSWKFSDSFFLLIFWKGYVSVPSSREKRWSQWSWWREKREQRKKRKRLQKRWRSWDRRGCCFILFLNDTCEIWVLTSMPPLQNLSFHEFLVMLFRLLKLCFGWSWGGNLWVVWPPKYFKCQVGDANVEASETGSNPNELPDLPEDLEEEPFASLHPSLRIWRWNDREISLRILLVWCFGFHYTSCCELIHSAAWVWTHGPFCAWDLPRRNQRHWQRHKSCKAAKPKKRPRAVWLDHSPLDWCPCRWVLGQVIQMCLWKVRGLWRQQDQQRMRMREKDCQFWWTVGCCWLFKSRVHQWNIGII